MICEKCGAEVSGKFCSNCGYENVFVKKFCDKCGKENEKKQELCVNCGSLLAEKKITTDNKTKNLFDWKLMSNNDKRIILYFINWGLLLAIIAIFLFSPIINVSNSSKAELEQYNKWWGSLPEEFTLYDITSLLTEDVSNYFEWLDYNENIENEDLDEQGKMLTIICGFTLMTIVVYIITIICYVNALINSGNNRVEIVKQGKAFCGLTVMMIAICFILLFFAVNNRIQVDKIEYVINPMVIFAGILCIINWKFSLEKYDELY